MGGGSSKDKKGKKETDIDKTWRMVNQYPGYNVRSDPNGREAI